MAIFEMVLNRFGAIAGHNEDVANAILAEALDDVLEDWLSLHFEHWFGKLVGQLAHSRAFARG